MLVVSKATYHDFFLLEVLKKPHLVMVLPALATHGAQIHSVGKDDLFCINFRFLLHVIDVFGEINQQLTVSI
jgi:hypothetical protein